MTAVAPSAAAQGPRPAEAPATREAPASFYAISHGNDCYWRVEAPAKAIGAKAFLLPEEARPKRDEKGRFNGREPSAAYSLWVPNDDSMFPWSFLINRNDPDDWEVHFPEHEGTAVWTRPDLPRAALAAAMRYKLGIRTLAEVDDNYTGNAKNNVFMRASGWDDEGRLEHLRAMGLMNGIVFSTAYLRDIYHRLFRKELRLTKEYMPELFVCQNNIAETDWPVPIPRRDVCRVGWMGSPSHLWDVNDARLALTHAKAMGCETWMVGFNPMRPWEGTTARTPERLTDRDKQLIRLWGAVEYKHIPWTPPQKFRRMALPFDISLCPLRNNDFTLGKSDVKFIEGTVSGAATIAANNVVYNRTIIHGETGLLVGSPDEMLKAVDLLVRNENLRERLASNAAQYVREYRGEKQLQTEWMEAIDGP